MRVVALLVLLVAVPAAASASPVPALVKTGPDEATATYADECSNGANSDEANRKRFIAGMLADKKSKLAQLVARLTPPAEDGADTVELGDWIVTFNERGGCADLSMSFSAFVYVVEHSTSHGRRAPYLITIDDDVRQAKRTLRLRSIEPTTLRTQSQ